MAGPDPIPQPYELVAARLRRSIHLGIYPPGSSMPPEREHSENLGVSRSLLRGALRMLVGEGLVETRRGATGGVFVLESQESDELIRARLRERQDELLAIMEFRIVNEALAARRAAHRVTEEDLQEIEDSITAVKLSETTAEFRQADLRFHLRVAEAAHCELLRTAVEDARVEMFLPFIVVDLPTMRANAVTEHRKVLTRLRGGDDAGAARAMEAHLESTRTRLLEILSS